MDVEEIRKLAENKIEADALTKQVKDRIKTTIWKKQNTREGFRESFKPLISQFEKPEDFKECDSEEDRKKNKRTENLFTQNLAIAKRQDAQIEKRQNNQEDITKN